MPYLNDTCTKPVLDPLNDVRQQTGHSWARVFRDWIDNDFRDPDADRYVACIRELPKQPWVCVLGDVTTPEQARGYTQLARSLVDDFPTTEFVIVPKCPEAFEIIDEQFVLGYPMGYSDIQAMDISTISDWRGRRVHLLGASPPKQFAAIQRLTQPTITGEPPADIVGLDWNGPQRVAYLGEYWSRNGWQAADQLSIRETVRKSLREMRKFWQERGVWPTETPIESSGPAVREPAVFNRMTEVEFPVLRPP